MNKKLIIISVPLVLAIALIWGMDGCVKRRDIHRESQMRGRSVEQVFDSHRDRLLSIPGVVGAGIAMLDDRPSLVVMVREKTPEVETQIPAELDGYPVVIEVTGQFKVYGDSL
jgi:hypothetical protein